MKIPCPPPGVIVWFRDPKGLKYLRRAKLIRSTRHPPGSKKIYFGGQEAIYGFSLSEESKPKWYVFEVYWLKDYDFGASRASFGPYADGKFYPCEAIFVEELLSRPGIFLWETKEVGK
ncbi:MAG: hypothetical protein QXR87_05465 [Candidatus Hadarchaeales archaeon]